MKNHEDTVNDLSKAIKQLYQDKELHSKMSKEARKRFENYFHWDRRGEQLNEIYQKF